MASTVYGWRTIENLTSCEDFTSCFDATCQELDCMVCTAAANMRDHWQGLIEVVADVELGIHERINKEKMGCKTFSPIKMDDFMVTMMDIIEGNDKMNQYLACA